MAREYRLISADSHILEPPHVWKQYLPRKFHDKAPKVVPDGDGGEAWQFSPDAPPAPIGIYASAGRKHEDVRWTGVTFAAANQGNFRAEPRLARSEEHTSELQSLTNLVCRLLLEKKKTTKQNTPNTD